jgi:hypothetical protein
LTGHSVCVPSASAFFFLFFSCFIGSLVGLS